MEVINFKPQNEKNNEAAIQHMDTVRSETNKFLASVQPVRVVVCAAQLDGSITMFEYNMDLASASLANTMVTMLANKKLAMSFQDIPLKS